MQADIVIGRQSFVSFEKERESNGEENEAYKVDGLVVYLTYTSDFHLWGDQDYRLLQVR